MALFVRVILTAVVSFVSDMFQALHALEVSMCERLEFSQLVFLICKTWIAYVMGYAKKMQKWLVALTFWRYVEPRGIKAEISLFGLFSIQSIHFLPP